MTNEAAERLRASINAVRGTRPPKELAAFLNQIEREADEALAAERRATVERIRAELIRWGYNPIWKDLSDILDAEAAR